MAYEKNPDELGALWLKSGSKGAYMTGTIDGVNVFCTPTKSDNPKAPAWRVLKSKPRETAREPQQPAPDADDIGF